MQEAEFIIFWNFQKYTNASLDYKVLLLFDNHSSHISIQSLDFCKLNGTVVLSFPPQCSHKLQSLNRSVYRPLKKAVNTACGGCMESFPGKTITLYNIPGIVKTALPPALTKTNIQAGVRCTGIFHCNREIFTELNFVSSHFTDRLVVHHQTETIRSISTIDRVPSSSSSDTIMTI